MTGQSGPRLADGGCTERPSTATPSSQGDGRALALWRLLTGPPLRVQDVSREQISPVEGLSALSLDALSSAAYGPEAILAVLAAAGAASLHLVLPVILLYAIGVFTGFTLAQAGLVVHWRRSRPRHWRHRAVLNGTRAAATGAATLVFLATKFTEGAWVVALAIPGFIILFTRIEAYYERAAEALGLGTVPGPPRAGQTVVIVPVAGVSRLTQRAISEAVSISREVIAVTVMAGSHGPGSRRARLLQDQWARWDPGVPFHMLHTEYASVAGP